MTSSQTTRQAEVRSSAAVDSPPVGSWDGLLGLPLLCHRCFLDNNGNINSSDLKSKRFEFNYEPRITQDLVGLVQVLRLSLLKPMEHRFFLCAAKAIRMHVWPRPKDREPKSQGC